MTAAQPVITPCMQCADPIRSVRSRVASGRGRFCSRQCQGRYYYPSRLTPNTKPNRTSYKPGCNLGTSHPRWVEPIRFECINCHQPFERKPWLARQRGARNLYCSKACRGEHRRATLSGPNAPDWVGGPQTYRGRGWLTIRARVVAEQGGVCAHCGKYVGKSLPVNHIRPFREFRSPAEANQRENLVGLCQSCHMRAEPRPLWRRATETRQLPESSHCAQPLPAHNS